MLNVSFFVLSFFFSHCFIFAEPALGKIVSDIKNSKKEMSGKIADITIIQESEIYSEKGTMHLRSTIYKKSDKFRVENSCEFAGAITEETIIYDGRDYWKIGSGLKQKINRDEMLEKNKTIALQKNWWEIISEESRLEQADDEVTNCYIILSDNNNETYRCWVNRDNLLLEKIEIMFSEDDSIIIVYGGFESVVDGHEMATKIELYRNGILDSRISIKKIDINTGVSDELFDPDREKSFDLNRILKDLFQ